MGAKQWHQTK